MHYSRWTYLILLPALLVAAGCSHENGKTTPGAAFEKAYEADNASAVLRVDRMEITTADTVEAELDVTVDEGCEVTFPVSEGKLGDFTILDVRDSDPVLTGNGRKRLSQTWQLEPFLAGAYEIPPLKVQWHEKDSDAEPGSIETDAVQVQVTSLIDAEEKPELKSIAPPVDLPPSRLPWIIAGIVLAVIALLLAGLALLIWFVKKQAGKAAAPYVMPPHLVAFQQLEKLLADDLVGKGEIKLFHIRLSDILRWYLEDRFRLRAPERTTEEFLIEAGKSSVINAAQRDLLQEFLGQCDLVKFARHEPDRAEIESLPPLCRRFIEELEAAHAPESVAQPQPGEEAGHAL